LEVARAELKGGNLPEYQLALIMAKQNGNSVTQPDIRIWLDNFLSQRLHTT
jgi:hypothetical protein